MTIATLQEKIPDYARDIRLNLGALTTIATLNPQQLWGTIVAAAAATRNQALLHAVLNDAKPHLTAEAVTAAKMAAAIMAMNNIYYRFTHLVANEAYRNMPARLRMTALAKPGVERLDFELWALAVSSINGCGMCMESHEHEVLAKGATPEMVQDAIRIAAILHAVAVTLEVEQAA
ncbi:MAG: carboxymuconolactone decarboxylase family protein [Alphaproteobacteria bacterium]